MRCLSGGRTNRLLLAKLFTSSNILVLDEPTNDLDAETLELLEELLMEYPGTLLIVSHDRAFLNNVVTSTLVFEGDGQVKDYAGGYDDWLRQKQATAAQAQAATVKQEPIRAKPERAKKLSFKDRRKLETLPQLIEQLETEQADLHQKMADPAFYQQGGAEIARLTNDLETIHQRLQTAYARWEELES